MGVKNAYIDENKNLIFELTDGTTINAGSLADSAATKYTVVFKDYDGTVLKTCTVEKGGSATAPAAPTRSGYTFIGWDKSFSNVTSDLIVTAQYEIQSSDPALKVATVTASAGQTQIAVPVSIKNNPGFLGMTLNIKYDSSALTLTKVTNGADFSNYNFTAPKNMKSGCNAAWYTTDLPNTIVDGDVMVLYFTVSSSAAAGSYDISVSCTDGDTFDADYNTISLTTAKGCITVK